MRGRGRQFVQQLRGFAARLRNRVAGRGQCPGVDVSGQSGAAQARYPGPDVAERNTACSASVPTISRFSSIALARSSPNGSSSTIMPMPGGAPRCR